ncbi:uncharacterized protein RCC_03237 [Ramularia collo-cygni]|uniref:F-box domain-containing protein n=1 Tax=Ramularia collo-cygni TaxID=112498 RepID=A0A2D3VAF0_9PEZI|nr:uncharacterized protein RCC_03237 [Ramularia collo-cygni]CZT17403.1 uncharacterized protein RCC_03237 [Ramularia collo-cygni]
MSLSHPPLAADMPTPTRNILSTMPSEIQDFIYKYALLEPDTKDAVVQVHRTGYSRPGLLQTCKQIRSDALKIWYYGTKFHVRIHDFDSAPLQKWGASFTSIGLIRGKVTMYSTPRWEPSWDNLIVWLELYHAGILHGRCPQPAHLLEQAKENRVDLQWYFPGVMFDVAKALRHVEWKEVKEILVSMRTSLLATDSRWND